MEHIPLERCENGRLYRLHSRNLQLGVWNEHTKGFVGIRVKFGDEFLFTEYHYDTGPPFGTARPMEDLGVVYPSLTDLELPWERDRALFDWLDAQKNAP